MKAREYCCCAIPLVNAGIYFTLIEQFALGILVGILSVATPSIVGAVTPSFAPWLLGIICFVAGGVQVLGFIGVAQEKPILFRRYISLHSLSIVAAFSVALAWVILSLTRHSTAQSNCLNNFFANADSEQKTEGNILCKSFLGSMSIYLYVVLTSYSMAQQQDHAKYDAFTESTTFNNESIPMNHRNDAWDSRPSTEALYQQRNVGQSDYAHLRKDSTTSLSDQPSDGYSVRSYPPPMQRQPSLPQPSNVLYYSNNTGNLDRPALTQAHPAEGSFGRKTPRLTKTRPFDDGYR
ncbi:hypothetical protein B0H10DRAFT_2062043 [Mycena sp. CBHHK59/15]|nr:hypothetical protein B0H10DRAFT_2062043 [Mycena sp. CBHHK59/15]